MGVRVESSTLTTQSNQNPACLITTATNTTSSLYRQLTYIDNPLSTDQTLLVTTTSDEPCPQVQEQTVWRSAKSQTPPYSALGLECRVYNEQLGAAPTLNTWPWAVA